MLRTTLRFVPPPALAGPAGRARAAAAVHDALEAVCPAGARPGDPAADRPLPVGEAVERAVRAWSAGRAAVSTARSGPRAGSLAPVAELADGVLTGSPHPLLVVAAAAQGNVAFAALPSTYRPEPTKRCDTC